MEAGRSGGRAPRSRQYPGSTAPAKRGLRCGRRCGMCPGERLEQVPRRVGPDSTLIAVVDVSQSSWLGWRCASRHRASAAQEAGAESRKATWTATRWGGKGRFQYHLGCACLWSWLWRCAAARIAEGRRIAVLHCRAATHKVIY